MKLSLNSLAIQVVKFGNKGLGMGFLYLNFIESHSEGVLQIKMSRTSINVPIDLRPLLICLAGTLRVLFFQEVDTVELF